MAADESVVGLLSSIECRAQKTRYDTYRDADYSERTVINQQRFNVWGAVAKLMEHRTLSRGTRVGKMLREQELRFSTLVEIRRSD